MKKILIRTLGIIVVLVVGLIARNYLPSSNFTSSQQVDTSQLTQEVDEHIKLGIVPYYYTDESINYNEAGERIAPGQPTSDADMQEIQLAGGRVGTVLDAYNEYLNDWLLPLSFPYPQIDLIFPNRGCTPVDELEVARNSLIDFEKVDVVITLPCAIDEVQLDRGKEEIGSALSKILQLRSAGLLTGDQGGAYAWSGDSTFFIHRLMEEQMLLGNYQERSTDVFSQMLPEREHEEGGDIADRTEEAVNEQLERWNYCETDSDCEVFYGECPFGCWQVVHKQFVRSAKQLIQEYLNQQAKLGNPQCVYDCMSLEDVVIQCGPAGTPKAGKCQVIRE